MITLDIVFIETYHPVIIAVADISQYPSGNLPQNPALEVTVPGFSKKVLSFYPGQINIYNSFALGLSGKDVSNQPLPDGIWTFRYSVKPNYENYIQRSLLRIDQLKQKLDVALLKTLSGCCEQEQQRRQKKRLEEVFFYLQTATAAANTCNEKLALDLYLRAKKILERCNC